MMVIFLTLMQQAVPEPQLTTDGAVVRWTLAAVVLCLLGVVTWLMKLATDKDKLFVESMRDNQKQAKELTESTVRALKDLSDTNRASVDLLARKIDDHTSKINETIHANHKEVLDRLRKGPNE